MDDEFFEHAFYYEDRYYTFSDLYEMYKKLPKENKKLFKDALAHYTLAEILRKCLYDKRLIAAIEELADKESTKIGLYGVDCGRILLGYERNYNSKLRKLINLVGKSATRDDSKMNVFINGEWLLNNLVSLTLGSSFEKDELEDFSLIKYQQFSDDECLAISNNFVRYMKGEEIVFYRKAKRLVK